MALPTRLTGHSEFMETPVGCATPLKVCDQQLVGAGVYIQIVSKNWVSTKEISFFAWGGVHIEVFFLGQSAQKFEG